MQVLDMHYDFKRKFNALDTSQRRSFQPQEIDWLLTEAQRQFVLSRLMGQGLVEGQKFLDDIRTLIKDSEIVPVDNGAPFPQDQLILLKAEAQCTKEGCGTKWIRIFNMSHDPIHETDAFAKSSFEWEELNAEYRDGAYKLFPTDFTVSKVRFTYVKDPARIYYAPTGYKLPNGTTVTGIADCQLPSHTHDAIVSLAVSNAIVDLQGDLSSRLQTM